MLALDDYAIDCVQVLSMETLHTQIFTLDVCSECCIPGDIRTEFAEQSWPGGMVDADFSLPAPNPEAVISNDLLPCRIEWTNSTEDFEQDLLSIDLDPELGNADKPRAGWFESRSARPSAFLTSALVHVAVFVLCFCFSTTQVAGTTGYAGNVIAASIHAHEDLIPQDESPGSVDSPASVPAIARQAEKLKEPPEKASDMRETDPQPDRAKLVEKKEEPKEPDKELSHEKGDPQGDSPQNSLASTPSIASPERRFIPAAGQGGKAFDSLVLSAIRESIFFPKQAAQGRQHGEVLVAFSINKECSISNLSVTRSSGFTILDEAAIKIIQKAAKKFPSYPEGINTDALHFVVPILFKEKASK